MRKFEYKTLIVSVMRQNFFSQRISPDCSDIEQNLNSLGQDGWELVSVFPFTNGGSPAAIEQAIHYFRRELLTGTSEVIANQDRLERRSHQQLS